MIHPLGRLMLALVIPSGCGATDFEVTSLGDVVAEDGAVTLREALLAANTDQAPSGDTPAGNGADRISFAATLFNDPSAGPVLLRVASPLPVLEGELTIIGPGADALRITAADGVADRVFRVAAAADVALSEIGIGGCPAGAIRCAGTLRLERVELVDNVAIDGGGLLVTDGGNVLGLACQLIENRAAGSGGGLRNDGGTVRFEGSIWQSNQAGTGGGICLASVGTAELVRCSLAANTADAGGGGALANEGGHLIMQLCTVSGNSAAKAGGALWLKGTNDLASVTVYANATAAIKAGGVQVEAGELTLQNSLFAANTSAFYQPDCVVSVPGALVSRGHNFLGDGSGSGLMAQSGDQIGTSSQPLDARLRPLAPALNGLPVHLPHLDSPCVDAGHGDGFEWDQRSLARRYDIPEIPEAEEGDGTDIGAVELQPRVRITAEFPAGRLGVVPDFRVVPNEPWRDFLAGALSRDGARGYVVNRDLARNETRLYECLRDASDGSFEPLRWTRLPHLSWSRVFPLADGGYCVAGNRRLAYAARSESLLSLYEDFGNYDIQEILLGPNERFLYLSLTQGIEQGCLLVLEVNRETGELSLVERLCREGADGEGHLLQPLTYPQVMMFHPDGRRLLVGVEGHDGSKLLVFRRQAATGRLTLEGEVAGIIDGGLRMLVLSPSGDYLYTTRYARDLVVYRIDWEARELQVVQELEDGADDGYGNAVSGLAGSVQTAVLSRPGDALYVFGSQRVDNHTEGSLLLFDRDQASGRLRFRETLTDERDDAFGNLVRLPYAITSMESGPDGRHFYVFSYVRGGPWMFARERVESPVPNASNEPAIRNHTDFGLSPVGGPGAERTFIVRNEGEVPAEVAPLELPTGFAVVDPLPVRLSPGTANPLSLRLETAALGTQTGEVQLYDGYSGLLMGSFAIKGEVVGPWLRVTGNEIAIVDGDETPEVADGTHFGVVDQGVLAVERTFRVLNDGNRELLLGGLTWPAGFSLKEGLVGAIAAGDSDDFTVRLALEQAGTFAGWVTFTHSAAPDGDFSFAIAAEVVGPELEVAGNGVIITNNAAQPRAEDGTDIGTVIQGREAPIATFEVRNQGTGDLVIEDLLVNGGYTISEGLPGSLGPGQADTFSLQLTDTETLGWRSGQVALVTNDRDESPFLFTMQTRVLEPVSVTVNELPVPNANTALTAPAAVDFGLAAQGWAGPTQVFRVENVGDAVVGLVGPQVESGFFEVVTPLPATLASGGTAVFAVQLLTAERGITAGELTFWFNDEPFTVGLVGKVVSPPEIEVQSLPSTGPALAHRWTLADGGLDAAGTVLSGFGEPHAVVTTPAGRWVIVATGWQNGNLQAGFHTFARDPVSGGLAWRQVLHPLPLAAWQTEDNWFGRSVTSRLSADGQFLFVLTDGAALGLLAVDADDGSLSLRDVVEYAHPDYLGSVIPAPMINARRLAVDPTARHVYVVGTSAVLVLERDSESDRLALIQTYPEPALVDPETLGVFGIINDLVVSPDGRLVCLSAHLGGLLPAEDRWGTVVYERDPETGWLTYRQRLAQGNDRLAFTADGHYLISTTRPGGGEGEEWGIHLAGVDPDSQEIALLSSLTNGGFDYLGRQVTTLNWGMEEILPTFDDRVCVTRDDGLLVLELNRVEGKLALVQNVASQADPAVDTVVPELGWFSGAAISADARHVYALSSVSNSITLLSAEVGTVLTHGDETPGAADRTWFETALAGTTPLPHDFRVHNVGEYPLAVGAIEVPDGFDLIQDLPESVAPWASALFRVRLNTETVGLWQGDIVIPNNDDDEAPFRFAVEGRVLVGGPVVLGKGLPIPNGDDSPQSEDGTDFGALAVGATAPSHTFVVRNDEAISLTLGELSVPPGFAVLDALAEDLEPGAEDTVVLALDNHAEGAHRGWVQFAFPGGTFAFAITGVVATPPVILNEPADTQVKAGTPARFEVVISGSEPLAYEWLFNGEPRTGAPNGNELEIPVAQYADQGVYQVVVSNLVGAITSREAFLEVLSPPLIVEPPQAREALPGDTVTFAVAAAGTPPFTYQWRRDGVELLGADTAELILTAVVPADAGRYSVRVSNAEGSITSAEAALTVRIDQGRRVRVVSGVGLPGETVSVPVKLIGFGDESALGASLRFDPVRLTFLGMSVGMDAAGASLNLNPASLGDGRLGFALSLPADVVFAPGTQEVARLEFEITADLGPSGVPLMFTDEPVLRELSDREGTALPAIYLDGNVAGALALEADVAPLPDGNQALTVTDWVQVGRFSVGLDGPLTGGQFQRADCAPFGGLGNGALTVGDWVQAGRYVAGLDALEPAGGPSASLPALAAFLKRPIDLAAGPRSAASPARDGGFLPRELWLQAEPLRLGATNVVRVLLRGDGSENAAGFSLHFNPEHLRVVETFRGDDTAAATLNLNLRSAAQGRIGCALALPIGDHFAAGTNELLRLNFAAIDAGERLSPLALVDSPVAREVSDAFARPLVTRYVDALVAVGEHIVSPLQFTLTYPSDRETLTVQLRRVDGLPLTAEDMNRIVFERCGEASFAGTQVEVLPSDGELLDGRLTFRLPLDRDSMGTFYRARQTD